MTQHCDLVIRAGRVVTGDAEYLADVGIQGEAIVQIGGPMSGRARSMRRESSSSPVGSTPTST